jgi:hypothetical protein
MTNQQHYANEIDKLSKAAQRAKDPEVSAMWKQKADELMYHASQLTAEQLREEYKA